MPIVANPRNKLVNFRITEDELEQILETSRMVGFRSLSDFARTAVLRFGGVSEPGDYLKEHLLNIDERVEQMQADLHSLTASLRTPEISTAAQAG